MSLKLFTAENPAGEVNLADYFTTSDGVLTYNLVNKTIAEVRPGKGASLDGTPLTVTTDGAPGLTKAVEEGCPRSIRIRCWAHKMRNLSAKCPDSIWPKVKAQLNDMHNAPSKEEAKQRADVILDKYKRNLPEMCRCLEDDLEATLNHLLVPYRHQQFDH